MQKAKQKVCPHRVQPEGAKFEITENQNAKCPVGHDAKLQKHGRIFKVICAECVAERTENAVKSSDDPTPKMLGEVVQCSACEALTVVKKSKPKFPGNDGRLFTRCEGCRRWDWHEKLD